MNEKNGDAIGLLQNSRHTFRWSLAKVQLAYDAPIE